MFNLKSIILLACLVACVAAISLEHVEEHNLRRHVRSPDGSVDLTYKDDRGGREASVNYNQNLYRSDDGRVNIDAYANANRNFDYNQNSYGGGVRGSWRF